MVDKDKLIAAASAIEPYLDAIICYASTQVEHEPNRLAAEFRAALEASKQEARPSDADKKLLQDIYQQLRFAWRDHNQRNLGTKNIGLETTLNAVADLLKDTGSPWWRIKQEAQGGQVPPIKLDDLIPNAMRRYFRVCSSGGLSKKTIDKVMVYVEEAERLNYFKLAIAEAMLAATLATPAQAEQKPTAQQIADYLRGLDGMVAVKAEDANNYCRVLSALGMEEEGDPVAAIEDLKAAVHDAEEAAPQAEQWRKCEFCGCNTNAKARACCQEGRDADAPQPERVTLTPGQLATATEGIDFTPSDRRSFIDGVRFAERHHGIGAGIGTSAAKEG